MSSIETDNQTFSEVPLSREADKVTSDVKTYIEEQLLKENSDTPSGQLTRAALKRLVSDSPPEKITAYRVKKNILEAHEIPYTLSEKQKDRDLVSEMLKRDRRIIRNDRGLSTEDKKEQLERINELLIHLESQEELSPLESSESKAKKEIRFHETNVKPEINHMREELNSSRIFDFTEHILARMSLKDSGEKLDSISQEQVASFLDFSDHLSEYDLEGLFLRVNSFEPSLYPRYLVERISENRSHSSNFYAEGYELRKEERSVERELSYLRKKPPIKRFFSGRAIRRLEQRATEIASAQKVLREREDISRTESSFIGRQYNRVFRANDAIRESVAKNVINNINISFVSLEKKILEASMTEKEKEDSLGDSLEAARVSSPYGIVIEAMVHMEHSKFLKDFQENLTAMNLSLPLIHETLEKNLFSENNIANLFSSDFLKQWYLAKEHGILFSFFDRKFIDYFENEIALKARSLAFAQVTGYKTSLLFTTIDNASEFLFSVNSRFASDAILSFFLRYTREDLIRFSTQSSKDNRIFQYISSFSEEELQQLRTFSKPGVAELVTLMKDYPETYLKDPDLQTQFFTHLLSISKATFSDGEGDQNKSERTLKTTFKEAQYIQSMTHSMHITSEEDKFLVGSFLDKSRYSVPFDKADYLLSIFQNCPEFFSTPQIEWFIVRHLKTIASHSSDELRTFLPFLDELKESSLAIRFIDQNLDSLLSKSESERKDQLYSHFLTDPERVPMSFFLKDFTEKIQDRAYDNSASFAFNIMPKEAIVPAYVAFHRQYGQDVDHIQQSDFFALLRVIQKSLPGDQPEKDTSLVLRDILRQPKITRSSFYPSFLESYLYRGGQQALGFVANALQYPNLNDERFLFFSKELIKRTKFENSLENYLLPENIPFLRESLTRFPYQFNQIFSMMHALDGLEQNNNAGRGIANKEQLVMVPISTEVSERVLTIVEKFGSVTPSIYHEYWSLPEDKREEYVERILQSTRDFYKNTRIHLENKDLSDLIILAFKPNGMTSDRVRFFVDHVHDKVEDLDQYSYQEEGYELEIGEHIILPKEGEKLNLKEIERWKFMLRGDLQPLQEQTSRVLADFLSGHDIQKQYAMLWKVFSSPLKEIGTVKEELDRYGDINNENAYQFLYDLKKYISIDIQDNFDAYKLFLINQEPITSELRLLLENLTYEHVSEVFNSLQSRINTQLSKFSDTSSVTSKEKYRAYFSKNIPSFFAKAATGICTAQDIDLFERADYFHINLINSSQQFVANIQAYILDVNGKSTLLLRGFNPISEWKEGITDAQGFTEQILAVGKKFAEDNNISSVAITPQTSWHELSNYQGVAEVLVKNYHTPDRKRDIPSFPVSSNRTIDNLFIVWDSLDSIAKE